MVYYQSDRVEWSDIDLCNPFFLYNFKPGCVHLFLQEVESSGKQAPGNPLLDQILGLIPVRYSEASALDKAGPFVRDFLGMLAFWVDR